MKNSQIKQLGQLTINNVVLEPHELATIKILLANGYDVELLQRSRTPYSKTADIFMNKITWEMKSPNGKDLRSIERALRRATHQSENIIIDLRRSKIREASALALLEKLFIRLRSVRTLWIVTKSQEIKKYSK